MHKWDDLNYDEYKTYHENRMNKIIIHYNALNKRSMSTTPFIVQNINFRKQATGNSDQTKSAIRVEYRYLQPRLEIDLSNLDDALESNFNLTWSRNSILAEIISHQILFLPLPASDPTNSNPSAP